MTSRPAGRGAGQIKVPMVAELLYLVGAVRQAGVRPNLPPSEALGRIRDAFRSYDEGASHKRAKAA
jgi:hypothetical protein